MPQRVRFAVLGVGYMGRAAIGALDVLQKRADVTRKFQIEICAVAEPNLNVLAKTREFTGEACERMTDSREALEHVIAVTEQDGVPAIIYDATSPLERAFHLDRVFEARHAGLPITLVGEKPIAVTLDDLALIEASGKDDEFFCEFIEMGNDAFVALKRYLNEQNLPIERIACWRANSSGIRKALGGGRLGVVGGALLDKSAHDIAIVASLLQSERASVETAEIHHVVPYSQTGWFTIRDQVQYGHDPGRWIGEDVLWPADGTTTVSSTWRAAQSLRGVTASFVWGWHGLTGIKAEHELAAVLTELGHTRPYKLEHEVDLVAEQQAYREPTRGLFGEDRDRVFIDDDVRLVIVWSGDHTIVCNLLGKHYEPGNQRLERYVVDYVEGQARVVYDPAVDEPKRDLTKINRRDLAEIFLRVMQVGEDASVSRDFARRRTEFVHRFVFDAQKKAIHDLASRTTNRFETILSESIKLVETKLRTAGEPEINEKHAGPASPVTRRARR